MGQYNLDRIFKPLHVAVGGASEKIGTIGRSLMKNLIDGGFSGMLLPVNPKYKTIHGHECSGSVSDPETETYLAGGKEVGEQGREIEEKIRLTACRWASYRRAELSGHHPPRREPQHRFCVRTVHGIVLQENRNMIALGKKPGFEMNRDSDSGNKRLLIHFGGKKS